MNDGADIGPAVGGTRRERRLARKEARAYRGGPNEVSSLEGLRLTAAVLVVLFHCQIVSAAIRGGGPPGMWLIRTGYFSVDALFVLSGLAQFLPFAAAPDRRQDWRGYGVRRFMRIVPAYWVAVAATTLYIGHLTLGPGRSGKVVGVWEMLIHLTFLQHIAYGISGQEGFGINTAMWTLTAEAVFYCVLPFVARRFLRHPVIGLLAALALSCAWRGAAIAVGTRGPSVYLVSQAPAFAFEFALGMAAAMLIVHLRKVAATGPATARRLRWMAAAAVVWGVAVLLAWQRAADPAHHGFSQLYALYDRFVWNLAPATAFAILVVGLALCPAVVAWPLANRVVRWAGETTYGTYLFHILVMLEISNRWKALGRAPLPLWQIGLATVVEAVLIGRLSFLVVEEPARRLGRRLAGRWAASRSRRSVAVAAASAIRTRRAFGSG